jgi:hypothetical protein
MSEIYWLTFGVSGRVLLKTSAVLGIPEPLHGTGSWLSAIERMGTFQNAGHTRDLAMKRRDD